MHSAPAGFGLSPGRLSEEMIHPFLDGNGRVGRLLISLHMIAQDVLPAPLLFLSPYLERHRDEYYGGLSGISTRGDWMGWITFFLTAVRAQAARAVETANQLVDLQRRTETILHEQGVSERVLVLAKRLFARPLISVKQAAEELGVSHPTAGKYLRQLEHLGFVEEITGRSWGQQFMALRVFHVIEAAGKADGPQPEARQ